MTGAVQTNGLAYFDYFATPKLTVQSLSRIPFSREHTEAVALNEWKSPNMPIKSYRQSSKSQAVRFGLARSRDLSKLLPVSFPLGLRYVTIKFGQDARPN
jgi:hypothetical protein